ncbi:MAG TPA: hypothetical protein VJW20_20270 [Candidatus Angelobacter sp.]|nr:hypothetical protein [Candidatus Angelobacter sp.]
MTLNGQWIELFRAGEYGDKGSYSEGDIDKMIANYDPAAHEAPIVIGHPEHNAPAYGWVESLKRVGQVLMGKLKQVQPAFEDMVRKGMFKKRSISFYVTPNGPALRHVGFLGAMPPEVKGLADVKLASFSAGTFQAIDFAEKENEMDNEQIKKSFMEALKEFFGIGVTPKLNLSDDDQAKKLEAAVAAAIKPLQDQNTKLQQQFDDLKKDADKRQQSATAQTQQAFGEKQIARLKDKRRWLPAFDKMGLPAIFTELEKIETKISFGEGDKKTEKPAAEAFADFLEGLGEIVPIGEITHSQRTNGKLVKFNEPNPKSGSVVDEQSHAMAEAATRLAKDKNISYGEALRQVRASGEFEDAGSAAAGAV